MATRDDADDLFQEVGKAIIGWQFIESTLAAIFVQMVAAADRDEAAAHAHLALPTTKQKLDVLDAAAAFALTNEQRAEWNKLREDIKRAAKHRNALAHGMWDFFGGRGIGPHPLKNSIKAATHYDIERVRAVRQQFAAVEMATTSFLRGVTRWP